MSNNVFRLNCNGIFLGLVCLLLIFLAQDLYLYSTMKKENNRFNLLLITIDTLRSDRLSCYSPMHLQTPNIDQIAERGVLFSRAFAHTSTTLPSHANILCGTTPLYHGIHDNLKFFLRPEFLTLAEHLKAYNYSTGAFIGGFPLDSRFGLDQGFDTYDDNFMKKSDLEIRAEFIVSKALSWLRNQKHPWFLWAHCYDPHDPYEPPEPFGKQYEKAPYDGEVAYVDTVLGELFGYLETNNLHENTIIIITGDHGEALGQHGELFHGFFAYNEVIWIPLIISSPGITPGQIDQNVSHVDIFPTVCDLLDIKKPDFLQGKSLLPAMNRNKMPERIIYFESLYPYYRKGWAPLRGFIQKSEKYIESPIPELYDLAEDFCEMNNLINGQSLDDCKKRLERLIKDQSNPEIEESQKNADEETLRKLASLGYVSNPNISFKVNFTPKEDIKTLLPLFNKANRAKDQFQRGELPIERALEIFKEVITESEKIDFAYVGLAAAYRELGRSEDAAEVLKVGFGSHPESYEIFRDLILCLSDIGKYHDIITLCHNANFVQMDFETDTWNILGMAYWKTGDLEKAQETYKTALSIDNENPSLFNNVGNVYFSVFHKTRESTFLEKAMEAFNRAVELDPHNSQAYFGLGTACLAAHDLDKAIDYWEQAYKISPSHASTAYNLSRAYFAKGDKQKALTLLQQYIKNYSHLLSPENRKKFNELIQKSKN